MDISLNNISVVKRTNGYEIIINISGDTEFGLDFENIKSRLTKKGSDLTEHLKERYPDMKAAAVKFIVGGILVGTLAINLSDGGSVENKISSTGYTVSNIKIEIEGKEIDSDTSPINQNGRVLVPIRVISESIGAQVSWQAEQRRVTIEKDGRVIELYIDSNKAYADAKEIELDTAPIIVSARTMVPIRFVSEALDMDVVWDSTSKTVKIDSKAKKQKYYSVKLGDTLAKIASRFDVSVENLMRWNKLKDEPYAYQFIQVSAPTIDEENKNVPKVAKQYDFESVLGYAVRDYISQKSSYNSLVYATELITEVSTFTHQMNADASLTVAFEQHDIIQYCNQNGIQVNMLVNNTVPGGFSGQNIKAVLKDEALRTRLIENIHSEYVKHGYTGVEIDFEAIPSDCRYEYNLFLGELKEKTDAYISVAVPAMTAENINNWNYAYDFKTIGKIADRVLIMTYDQHWGYGPSGPIAAVDWVEDVIMYATSKIPKQKIMMGIAAYGYDWNLNGKGKAVTAVGLKNLMQQYGGDIKWNDYAKCPYYEYVEDGDKHIVWFENEVSNQYKYEIAKRYELGGIGLWRLGMEEKEFWGGLK